MADNPASHRCRVVFMGTPEFALPSLEVLLVEHDVVGVFTQPDRPAGRGRQLVSSPVKKLALEHGVPVFQPEALRGNAAALAYLPALAADVIVVAAYGLILPPEVLTATAGGALNVHASLLPRWRGAAPINYAILAGDTETGVTIMLLDEGLDTGPILAQRAAPIDDTDSAARLGWRLSRLGAELLSEVLPRWLAGEIQPVPQDSSLATKAPRLTRADGWLNWSQSADALARRVRAMNPWPGAYTDFDGQMLKVHRATVEHGVPATERSGSPPGTVVDGGDGPTVITGDGLLRLDEVQPAGGRSMSGTAFTRGHPDLLLATLGGSRPDPR
jgi:methionyl-tRNA formyltransferase